MQPPRKMVLEESFGTGKIPQENFKEFKGLTLHLHQIFFNKLAQIW